MSFWRQNFSLNILLLIWYLLLLSRVGVRVTYKRGFWIGWLDLLQLIRSQLGTAGSYSSIAILHTFQFTVIHALGFSVFTSRILATDLSQSHCHFKSQMKSCLRRLISFLSIFCYCQFRRLDSNSSSPKLIYWKAGVSKLDSSLPTRLLFCSSEHFFISTLYGPLRKHIPYC
jgi:hypothetical protein